jgi:hypothetical protein
MSDSEEINKLKIKIEALENEIADAKKEKRSEAYIVATKNELVELRNELVERKISFLANLSGLVPIWSLFVYNDFSLLDLTFDLLFFCGAGEPFVLKKYSFLIDPNEDFPQRGGGRVIVERDWFIKKTASLVLSKGGAAKYRSYYWRAPVGSGKTTFLKLLGRELQHRGCDVRMLLAGQLEKIDDGYVSELALNAGSNVVALLVDEVHNNPKTYKWDELLKSKPSNPLTIGVGVPQLNGSSP